MWKYNSNRMVCDCYKLYVKDIEGYVKNGVATFDELVDKTKVGVLCSACTKDAMDIFEYFKNKDIVK